MRWYNQEKPSPEVRRTRLCLSEAGGFSLIRYPGRRNRPLTALQRAICRAVWRTEGERNSKARTCAGDRELAQGGAEGETLG